METVNDKLEALSGTLADAGQDNDTLRTPMTILFTDIKGSTRYAEKKGDIEYLSMINRHNRITFPIIESEGGYIVKTIGDSILARFHDPVAAVKAAAGMQRALARDGEGREEIDRIRIRIGLHYGMGLAKDNDVFGDVVNAASHVEHQAEAGQIFITGVLLDAAKAAGFACARMGRAELKGKDEPIDLYAVAWSESATYQLIEHVQTKGEKELRELRKQWHQLQEEFDGSHEQWRADRRILNTEIETLQGSLRQARQEARQQFSDDLQSELQFRIENLTRSRERLEADLAASTRRFEAERNDLKEQISAMQTKLVEAMERSNNPARVAMAVREQVEARLAEAKEGWQLEWESERRRLLVEIERLKASSHFADGKREAARRAVLEKLGKLPARSPAAKTAVEWEREFQDAKIQWDTERGQLQLKVRKLESDLRQAQDTRNSDIVQEMRAQYENKLAEAHWERQRLEREIQLLTNELSSERQGFNARIKYLEAALPEAQEAVRKQVLAEMQNELDVKVEEANRIRSRIERSYQDAVDDWETERRRAAKRVAELEEQLKEAREAAYKAQKSSPPLCAS
jgi:class 3 adenylate cyclase/chromosome segregation ATPase